MSSTEILVTDEKKSRKTYRLGLLPLLVFGLVAVGLLAGVIVLAVFYVQQGDEIAGFNTTVTPTGATPAPHPGPLPVSYRLPTNIIPSHYDLYLQIFLPYNVDEESAENAFTTAGKVVIDVTCVLETNVIVLHAWNLTINPDRVTITNASHHDMDVMAVNMDPLRHFLFIHFETPLVTGQKYQIEISYTGLIVAEMDGLYRSKYTHPSGGIRWIATTQFQPHKARRMFPCFDEPSLKATFQFTVKHDSRHEAYSVRQALSRTVFKDEPRWAETVFERTVKMSSYLLALVVSDFQRSHAMTEDGIDFGVLSHKDTLPYADFALRVGMNMTTFSGIRFNMSYHGTNPKMDMVAIPDFDAGAMENWGLIVYREPFMLYQRGVDTPAAKVQIAKIVAHELAHQWFGNSVTCAWWSEIFLNEGFASFLELPLVQNARPQWEIEKSVINTVTRPAMLTDAEHNAVPLVNPTVNTPEQIMEMFRDFNSITYAKGAMIARMIEGVLGHENLYQGLTSYLAERVAAGGNANYKQLLQALTDYMAKVTPAGTTPLNVLERFDEWMSTSGFPLVTVRLSSAKDKFTLTQTRFLTNNASALIPGVFQRAWSIPVTYVAKANGASPASLLAAQTTLPPPEWFLKADATKGHDVGLAFQPEWVLANLQSMGFYRVNYDVDNWNALANQLKTAHEAIHILSRVQLIEDSFALARKGVLDFSVPVKMIGYIQKENEYHPWVSALLLLNYIDDMTRSDTSSDALPRFMKKAVGGKYADNFWNSKEVWIDEEKELFNQLSLHQAIVENACYYGVEACAAQATVQFNRWLANSPVVPIDLHFKEEIYCYGVRSGGAAAFNALLERYNRADAAATRVEYIAGLGCAQNVDLLQILLKMTLNAATVRPQHVSAVLTAVSKFTAGANEAWSFLKANWNSLPASQRGTMVTNTCRKFSTENQLNDVTAFYESLESDIRDAEKAAFENILSTIKQRIQWRKTNAATVFAALTAEF